MSEQQSTVDIQAPRQLVWDVLTDVQSWPEWMAEVKEVRTQTPAGGLGAEYSLSQGIPALGLPMTVRVAAFDVPERLVLEQSHAPRIHAGRATSAAPRELAQTRTT